MEFCSPGRSREPAQSLVHCRCAVDQAFRRLLGTQVLMTVVACSRQLAKTSATPRATSSCCSPGQSRNPGNSSPCNTWVRASRGRSLLAAYSLTWEERGTERHRGTEACARASSQCSPLWGGDIRRLPGLVARGSFASVREIGRAHV